MEPHILSRITCNPRYPIYYATKETSPLLLPPELHEAILQVVATHGERSLLLACALTCRFWGQTCIPYLFRETHIRDSESMSNPRQALAAHGHSFISTYTRSVIVHTSDITCTDRHFLIALYAYFPLLEELHWDEKVHRIPRPRDLSHRLAQGTKGAYMQYASFKFLCSLTLKNHHFHSFADLLRISGSLVRLHRLDLTAVSWTHVPHSLQPFRRLSNQLVRVQASLCPSVWPLPWLWACYRPSASVSPAPPAPPLCFDDLYYTGQLTQLFGILSAGAGQTIVVLLDDMFTLQLSFTAPTRHPSTLDARPKLRSPEYSWHFAHPPGASEYDIRHVTLVDVLDDRWHPTMPDQPDDHRTTVDSVLAKLLHIRCLKITSRNLTAKDESSSLFPKASANGVIIELVPPKSTPRELELNNLLDATWGRNALQWDTAQVLDQQQWVAKTYLRNVEWGRGQHQTLVAAKEMAAYMAYYGLYKEIYGTPPPES